MNVLKRLLGFKPKPYLLDDTYRIVPAFDWKGVTYYMHEDPLNAAAGRSLTAMMHLEELIMRCSADYLNAHIDATNAILKDRASIDLEQLFKLNAHLKERVKLLIAVPDHVYKLASVVYFTKEESPFRYDAKFNEKKIEQWKQGEMYDFFCNGHLKNLIPSLALPEENSLKYSQLAESINHIHVTYLRELLSNKGMTSDIKN